MDPLSQILADFNYLVAIPNKLGNMQALRTLCLTQNLIRELRPGCLEPLTNLERLQMNHNRLKEVPRTIGLIHGLLYLDLSSNALEVAPKSIGVLTALTYLDLCNNRIQSVPVLTQLTTLSTLRVAHNHLVSLPMGLHKMTSLTRLDVTDNKTLEVPPMGIVLQVRYGGNRGAGPP